MFYFNNTTTAIYYLCRCHDNKQQFYVLQISSSYKGLLRQFVREISADEFRSNLWAAGWDGGKWSFYLFLWSHQTNNS